MTSEEQTAFVHSNYTADHQQEQALHLLLLIHSLSENKK
jgi:hypothetical protein